jgi:hypothetical protein
MLSESGPVLSIRIAHCLLFVLPLSPGLMLWNLGSCTLPFCLFFSLDFVLLRSFASVHSWLHLATPCHTLAVRLRSNTHAFWVRAGFINSHCTLSFVCSPFISWTYALELRLLHIAFLFVLLSWFRLASQLRFCAFMASPCHTLSHLSCTTSQ